MQILGIIPARYGSTRLEGKPLADIAGKPMIQRVYEQARKALTEVLVATDDQRIVDAVNSFGGNVILTSKAHTTGTNRCLEAYELYLQKTKTEFDVLINIQGDEPLLVPEQISQLANCFQDKTTEMATLALEATKDENLFEGGVYLVMDKYNNALYFSRSVIPFVRDQPKDKWTHSHVFYKHVGMYGFKPQALNTFAKLSQTSLEKAESLEQNRWLENGFKIKVAITKFNSKAVDTPEDLEQIKKLFE